MLTDGKIEQRTFSSTSGNPFKALAAEINKADAKRAAGLNQTRAARVANRAKRDGRGGAR